MASEPEPKKECRACGETKRAGAFYKRGSGDGLSGLCRQCFKTGAVVECERCGELFAPKCPNSTGTVCSRSCKAPRADLQCDVCGEAFTVLASQSDRRSYCSLSCRSKATWRDHGERMREALAESCAENIVKAQKGWRRATRERRRKRAAELARGVKTCPRCGEARPVSEYHANRSTFDGLASECRECSRQIGAANYRKNRAERLAYGRRPDVRRRRTERQRERYRSDPEWRRKKLLACRRSYRRRKAKVLAYQRRYYRENRERHAERGREWYRRNPHHLGLASRRRRARERAAPGTHAVADVVRLWHRQRGECVRCGVRFGKKPEDKGFHVDHIVPISRREFGDASNNWPRNLQLLCESCNCSKRDRTPAEFTLYLRRVGEA